MAITRSQSKAGYFSSVRPLSGGKKGKGGNWLEENATYLYLALFAAGLYYVCTRWTCILKAISTNLNGLPNFGGKDGGKGNKAADAGTDEPCCIM